MLPVWLWQGLNRYSYINGNETFSLADLIPQIIFSCFRALELLEMFKRHIVDLTYFVVLQSPKILSVLMLMVCYHVTLMEDCCPHTLRHYALCS